MYLVFIRSHFFVAQLLLTFCMNLLPFFASCRVSSYDVIYVNKVIRTILSTPKRCFFCDARYREEILQAIRIRHTLIFFSALSHNLVLNMKTWQQIQHCLVFPQLVRFQHLLHCIAADFNLPASTIACRLYFIHAPLWPHVFDVPVAFVSREVSAMFVYIYCVSLHNLDQEPHGISSVC